MKCNKAYRLTYTDKAMNIVEKMTLEEKVYLMSGRVSAKSIGDDFTQGGHYNQVPYPAGGNERLGVPEMLFCDGPRGAVQGNSSTCFPVPMGRGASFDVDLEERIGRAISREIRAHGGNFFGGVCVNLPYNPGWGRSQETYGEESFHLGQMGAALTRGIQKENVIACVKHYAFNSMEISRFKVNIIADERTEREVHLSPFKDCIDAGAASVMSAYNLYQGIHCGHHDYLLNNVLKQEWGFDGFVISDFILGVKDTVEAANGGQDIEMCHTAYFGDNLVEAVKNGHVSEEKIDQAAVRIVRTLLAFNEADSTEYDKKLIGSKEHISLAIEAAEKSMTLIKNNHVLPFSKSNCKKIAVLGKLGNHGNIGDFGSSRVFPEYVVTPLEGIQRAAPNAEVSFYDGADLERAKEIAKSADAVVFVVGFGPEDEGEYIEPNFSSSGNHDIDLLDKILESMGGEINVGAQAGVGGDRKNSLGLHVDEIELIKKVGPVNTQSVVVLIGGNMVMMEEWKDSVSAILMAYYPGMEGGSAIARTLFGEVNPRGKIPFVVPFKESDLPQVKWDTTEQFYDYYHGYAKLEKEAIPPSLPYGFGLSYTTFMLSNATFAVQGDSIIACCDVENIGNCIGDEVVQFYIGFKNTSIDRPVKLLRGFKRITLEAGKKQHVAIHCPVEKIKWFNPDTHLWELELMDYEVYIGNSAANENLICGTVRL